MLIVIASVAVVSIVIAIVAVVVVAVVVVIVTVIVNDIVVVSDTDIDTQNGSLTSRAESPTHAGCLPMTLTLALPNSSALALWLGLASTMSTMSC